MQASTAIARLNADGVLRLTMPRGTNVAPAWSRSESNSLVHAHLQHHSHVEIVFIQALVAELYSGADRSRPQNAAATFTTLA